MELLQAGRLKLLFHEDPTVELLAAALFTPAGASVEPVEGITLLALRSAFKRSSKRSLVEFATLQDPMGSAFVPEVSLDYSALRFQLVSEYTLPYFELFVETALNPCFEQESFAVEKEALIASIRSKSESSFTLAYEELMRLTYRETPYGRMPYGTVESVSSVTADGARDYYFSTFFPEGSVLALSGKAKELDRVAALLEQLPSASVSRPVFEAPIKEPVVEVVNRAGSAQTFVMIAFEAPPVNHPLYPVYKLLNTVIGEGIGSLLFQELREKRGYAYSTGSLYPSRLSTARLLLYVGTSPEKEGKLERDLGNLLRSLPDLITEEHLERAVRYFEGTYLLDHESRSRRAWYLGFWEALGLGADYDEKFLDLVKSVTLQQLREAAYTLSASPYHQVTVRER